MGKEKSTGKKEKKEKKAKRAEEDGVSKSKKDKKSKSHGKLDATLETPATAAAVLNKIEKAAPGSVALNGNAVKVKVVKDEDEIALKKGLLVGAMVPFANPLADEKTMKKVLKGVKKSAKHKTLKRGVKEVVKALRKSDTGSANPPAALVVLAADISPYDVISHIPVLCEDHNIPYIYVPSRAELGAAGSTKRPTSVVMITPQEPKPKAGSKPVVDDGEESWSDVYADLAKALIKAGRDVRI